MTKSLKHVAVTEEQYWEIKKHMARLKINRFHDYWDHILDKLEFDRE